MVKNRFLGGAGEIGWKEVNRGWLLSLFIMAYLL